LIQIPYSSNGFRFFLVFNPLFNPLSHGARRRKRRRRRMICVTATYNALLAAAPAVKFLMQQY
jgi:hypothetical protein